MNAPLLTIAIPVFDRNEVLAQTGSKLLPRSGAAGRVADCQSPSPELECL